MLKFVAFGALLSTIAAAGQCYHDGWKMTKFTTGDAEGLDQMSTVPESDKAYDKETVKTCPDGESCFTYTVSATADVTFGIETVPGNMEFEAQSCMDNGTAQNAVIGEVVCEMWEVSLSEEFAASEELKDVFSGVETTCGSPTECAGDECVLEDDRSGASTLEFAAIFLTSLYLLKI
ncbi:hypothetical protein ACHWQZ_G012369 [Mnemiopsis leidyi]